MIQTPVGRARFQRFLINCACSLKHHSAALAKPSTIPVAAVIKRTAAAVHCCGTDLALSDASLSPKLTCQLHAEDDH